MRTVLILMMVFSSSVISQGAPRFGVSSVDITPSYPIRLNGYAARHAESEGVAQPIFAKALAFEWERGTTALMLTIDTCAISREIRDEIVKRIGREHAIAPERIVIFCSHTHAGPCLKDAIANIFVGPLSSAEQAAVDRYTRELIAQVVGVASAALSGRQEGHLYFGQGAVEFAKNRRTEGGPVDHSLPVLFVKDREGEIKAVLANYACHCTTLGGDFNQIHPDWAGVARRAIEANHPGAVALMAIGCGADANPAPRGRVDDVEAHGKALAAEVEKLARSPLKEITEAPEFRVKALELPFDPLPTREEWTRRAAESGIVGYHARRNLERLERGETLPTSLPYQVQTWNFGQQLALVFLPGEVVVDYALSLRSDYDPQRLWISAYSNWVPCYIPSERILREGGYEAETSLWYYDRPARLSPKTESLIVGTVHELVPKEFLRKR